MESRSTKNIVLCVCNLGIVSEIVVDDQLDGPVWENFVGRGHVVFVLNRLFVCTLSQVEILSERNVFVHVDGAEELFGVVLAIVVEEAIRTILLVHLDSPVEDAYWHWSLQFLAEAQYLQL